jgi:hypothetical protein
VEQKRQLYSLKLGDHLLHHSGGVGLFRMSYETNHA